MLEFNIPNISCGHCVRAVTEAVHEADPQAVVNVDLPQHRVTVHTSLPRDTVARQLADAGYAPESAAG